MQSQPLGGRHLPETDATVIGIVRVQLLGLHQLSQSLLHTLSHRDIQADVQVRVERVRDTEAAETLDLRPPGPAEDLTDDGGVLGGMARRLGCTQAPLLHGIQSEHQKLVGIFLLVSVDPCGAGSPLPREGGLGSRELAWHMRADAQAHAVCGTPCVTHRECRRGASSSRPCA